MDLKVRSHQDADCVSPETIAQLFGVNVPLYKPLKERLLYKMSARTFRCFLRISRRKQSQIMNTVKFIKSLLDVM